MSAEYELAFTSSVCLLAGILLVQLRRSLRGRQPVLAVLTLGLIVYFVYGALVVDAVRDAYSAYFDVEDHYYLYATLLAILTVVCIRLGYAMPQRVSTLRRSVQRAGPAKIAVLSLVGVLASVAFVHMGGGLWAAWSRQSEAVSFAGTLQTLSNLSLIFPLFAYYYRKNLSPAIAITGWAIGLVYLAYAVISGRSTQHVINLIPFAVVLLGRGNVSFRHAIFVVAGGTILISVLRYFRQLGGALLVGDSWTDALAVYLDAGSKLALWRTFGEFHVFAKTIEVVEDAGYLYGRSYLVALVSVLPGILAPWKIDFLAENRADGFLPLHTGHSGQLWPSGFYGEAYMNLGIVGVVAVACTIGWLARRADLLFASPGATFGIPHWYFGCVLASALAGALRGDLSYITSIFGLQVLAVVALVALLGGTTGSGRLRARLARPIGVRPRDGEAPAIRAMRVLHLTPSFDPARSREGASESDGYWFGCMRRPHVR